jgi:hypothetical protein
MRRYRMAFHTDYELSTLSTAKNDGHATCFLTTRLTALASGTIAVRLPGSAKSWAFQFARVRSGMARPISRSLAVTMRVAGSVVDSQTALACSRVAFFMRARPKR